MESRRLSIGIISKLSGQTGFNRYGPKIQFIEIPNLECPRIAGTNYRLD